MTPERYEQLARFCRENGLRLNPTTITTDDGHTVTVITISASPHARRSPRSSSPPTPKPPTRRRH